MNTQSMLLLILLEPDTYSLIGWVVLLMLSVFVGVMLYLKPRRWMCWSVGTLMLVLWAAFIYGFYVGNKDLRVVEVEFESADLPPAFDGYRIVHFSDIHLEAFEGQRRDLLERVVDSIKAQHADMIVFTGDLQNRHPDEVKSFIDLLGSVKAPDGVYSVLGNHDYPDYLGTNDPFEISGLTGRSVENHQLLGWRLLCNSHHVIHRGNDSIVIAGMDNDGEGRFPQKGDIPQTLNHIRRNQFVVMLEHDPTSWRRKILPHCHAQLTLSGHTHGGQLNLLGWSPVSLRYQEYGGLYYMGNRALCVSQGVGGAIPFRLGVPPEIVVITLKKK
ncbi:MAG: metallophosphoesterase [Prevotella sp.]|nr:metallophosphoesterase [Prevotella sp.]